jgi:microcystin-dependent protein
VTDQFVGEIRMFAGNFAPNGWAMCNGQILPISQNTALFSLLGTQYGGNGTSTFALPNLQASFPLCAGNGVGLQQYQVGETGGAGVVTITQPSMPAHGHVPQASTETGTANSPSLANWAEPHFGRAVDEVYGTGGAELTMSAAALAPAGGGQPHNNLPPYLAVNFISALVGIFPPRS